MQLRLPPSLHYPITVTELLKQPNDYVERFAPLFSYFYRTTVTEGDDLGNERQVEKSFPARYESSVEGKLLRWMVTTGAVIGHSNMEIAEIDEPCDHSVQFGGMCVICGKDMTESTYITEQLDAARATINMDHNNVSLTVSPNEAAKVDDEAKRRLLASKKLSLVVDLDQTIIHATVDPTVNEWQRDTNNPNHEAVKDVQSFHLKDDSPRKVGEGCWYYIKLRPGLQQFLEKVSKLYEMHIYTMGTRQYAKNIANVIDPDRKIFGDRVLSRDESGSMTAKNLQRLFPIDTKMVVIIDDRGDVWKWSPNLIKVTPYDFFVGIGDINSSFLPKKPDLRTAAKSEKKAPTEDSAIAEVDTSDIPHKNGDQHATTEVDSPSAPGVDAHSSPLDHLVAMSGANGATSREEQTSSQDETLAAQLEEKPLLQKQKQLEADDAASEASSTQEESGNDGSANEIVKDSERPRHSLLHDNDSELFRLEQSLRSVHTAFFNTYAQQLAAAQGGRLGKLRGGQKQKSPTDKSDLDLVPDIKNVLPAVKSKVLGGTVLVFSGVVPLGMDVASTDIAILSRSFGAVVHDELSRHTTHLVAARNRTQKVRSATRRNKGRIKIVSPSWLLESIGEWERKDETPYLLDVEEPRNGSFHEDEILSESESDVSYLETSDSESEKPSERPSVNLTIKVPPSFGDDEETDVEGVMPEDFNVDDKSPVGGTNEDWSAMNDELKDFLGSDADDDDNGDDEDDPGVESETSTGSRVNIRGRKRGRREDDESDSGSDKDGQRKTKKRVQGQKGAPTQLSQSTIADEDGEDNALIGVKSPGADGDGSDPARDDLEGRKEGDGWSDFEDEDFEAELERAASEEQADA